MSNRNRLVLSEYFINQTVENAANLDAASHQFAQNLSEMVNIHYHTDFPGVDEINKTSEKDVSGRSFYYGIRNVPRIVVDGQTQDVVPVLTDGDPDNWAEAIFSIKSLTPAPFVLNIANPTASNGRLKVEVDVRALEEVNSQTVVHVVVIDSTVELRGNTYYNAVRKMLPDAAGTFRDQSWGKGDNQSLTFEWDYGSLGLDPSKFKIVAFVADYTDREIYQAAVNNVQIKRNEDIQGGNGAGQVTSLAEDLKSKNVKMFPNPSNHYLHIQLQNRGLSANARWEIISLNGQLMKQGVWHQGYKEIKLAIDDLADGVYIIKVHNDKMIFQRRFKKQR